MNYKDKAEQLQIENNELKAKEYKQAIAVRRLFAKNMESFARSRLGFGGGVFSSADGKRDYNEILGYANSDNLTYKDYYETYRRGDIASRVINAPVSALWSTPPTIYERVKNPKEGYVSDFDTKWEGICRTVNLWPMIRRVDKLTRIGRYGVLFLGFNDGRRVDQPVGRATKLLYVRPFGEGAVSIATYDNDTTSARYGLPVTYRITMSPINEPIESGIPAETKGVSPYSATGSDTTIEIHHTRVIHIIEDNLESPVYGHPALEPIYNRLQDLVKVVGGSSEMFWLGARPGLAAIADADTAYVDTDLENMQQQIEDFDNNLTRWLQLKGVKVENLAPQVYSPDAHFKVIIQCISAAVGIPARVLLGNESGQLASTQDQDAWESKILERRIDFAEPCILIPFITRLQDYGVLPDVSYGISWADLSTLSEAERADVAQKRATALNLLVNSGAIKLLGPDLVADTILYLDDGQKAVFKKEYEANKDKIGKIDSKSNLNGTTDIGGIPGIKGKQKSGTSR